MTAKGLNYKDMTEDDYLLLDKVAGLTLDNVSGLYSIYNNEQLKVYNTVITYKNNEPIKVGFK